MTLRCAGHLRARGHALPRPDNSNALRGKAATMPKRIVICSDGTGNSSIKGRGTNVFKLFEAIDLNGHRFDAELQPQIALYDDGVGTETFKPIKVFAGMTGFGLSRNVRQLYKELARVYDPGDEIWLFGFSRGAFTVRTLAGMIARCGVLDLDKLPERTARSLEAAVRRAYRFHRQCFRTKLASLVFGPARDPGDSFKKQHSVDYDVRIRFMGVWDTVDAVGLPFHLSDILNTTVYRFKFPDYKLSPLVDEARHALSLDDDRLSFKPLLWDERGETGDRIQQVWFAGAHSNVGGGYPKQGMSLVALDWMLSEAERSGLRVLQPERRGYRDHANVDDKLYDPRAGLGIFYRWRIRDVAALCYRAGVRPKIHLSAVERIAHGTDDYAPGNLPADPTVVFTEPAERGHRPLLLQRAANLEEVIHQAHSGRPSLLESVRGTRRLGVTSYYVYLITSTLVLLAAAGNTTVASLFDPVPLFSSVGILIFGLLSNPFATAAEVLRRLLNERLLLTWFIGGFVIAWVLATSTDMRMSRVFSQFWYVHQQRLRQALQRARTDQQAVERDIRAGLEQDARQALRRGGMSA
jgi:uncharacterized protein (DUF2235 family)